MRNFIQYWQPGNARETLDFSASDQFLRRKIKPGDALWIITREKEKLFLFGTFVIARFIDGLEADRMFGKGIQTKGSYALPADDGVRAVMRIDISDIASELRFKGRADHLKDIGSGSIGNQLQSLRELTDDSVALLRSRYENFIPSEILPFITKSERPLRGGEIEPQRYPLIVSRIVRDSVLCTQLKHLHDHRCQICGQSILLAGENKYAEAHHIRPLGRPHNGPDLPENILIVCPNHHVMLDCGVFELTLSMLRTFPKHTISSAFIEYHNDLCRERRKMSC